MLTVARPPSETLTGREAQIMDVLWRVDEATAEQIRAGLPDPLHDSTVRTLLRVLVSKGYVAQEARGKAFVLPGRRQSAGPGPSDRRHRAACSPGSSAVRPRTSSFG